MQPGVGAVAGRCQCHRLARRIVDAERASPANGHVYRQAGDVVRGQRRLEHDLEQIDHLLGGAARTGVVAMVPDDGAVRFGPHIGRLDRAIGHAPTEVHQVGPNGVAPGGADLHGGARLLQRGHKRLGLGGKARVQCGQVSAVAVARLVGMPPGRAAQAAGQVGRLGAAQYPPGAASGVDAAVGGGGLQHPGLEALDRINQGRAGLAIHCQRCEAQNHRLGIEQGLHGSHIGIGIDAMVAHRLRKIGHRHSPGYSIRSSYAFSASSSAGLSR